jgi:hypothetical protein
MFSGHCLAMAVSSLSAVPAFSHYVSIICCCSGVINIYFSLHEPIFFLFVSLSFLTAAVINVH